MDVVVQTSVVREHNALINRRAVKRTRHMLAWWMWWVVMTLQVQSSGPPQLISDALIQSVQQQYGVEAERQLLQWKQLLQEAWGAPINHQLEVVNGYFNRQVQFTSDASHWADEDYWATPLETLGTAGGDCEDFVIAKYFSLLQLGIPLERLRITYVKALSLNQAHMVLAYYPSANAEPLILDNLTDHIQRASLRRDLSLVYSFNGAGMWLERMQGGSIKVGDPNRLSMWSELMVRMKAQGLGQFLVLP